MGAAGGKPSLVLRDPPVFLGGDDVCSDPLFFTENSIKGVVSLGDSTLTREVVKACPHLEVLHIPLPDVPSADLATHFAQITEFIAETRHALSPSDVREHSGPACTGVYVHCTAGISRSTTAFAAFLMVHLSPLSFPEALGHIHRCRAAACPNEGFCAQLRAFEGSAALQAAAARVRAGCAGEGGHAAQAARDAEFLADRLHAAAAKAQELRDAKYIYMANGLPVPAALEGQVREDRSGRGLVVARGTPGAPPKKVVLNQGDAGRHVEARNWALVDFDAQKETLRQRLRGREAEACRSPCLGWLLLPQDDAP